LCQNGDVRLEITVEDTNDAKEFATKDNDKLLSSRTPTNTANHWRGVEKWGPKPGSPNEYKKTAMSVDINSQVAQIFRRHDWVPGNAIMIMIKQGASGDNIDGRRIAKAWDEKLAMPAIRIVYHTDDTIAKSIEQYHQQVANDQGWDNSTILLFMLISGGIVGIGCQKYNKKYGRARNKKYKTVIAGGDEERAFAEMEDYSEGEDEYDIAKKKRNPVSGAKHESEGVPAGMQAGNIVYHDSRGETQQRGHR